MSPSLFLCLMFLYMDYQLSLGSGQFIACTGNPCVYPLKKGTYQYNERLTDGNPSAITRNAKIYRTDESNFVEVTWTPYNSQPENWTGYIIRWDRGIGTKYGCRLVPKNQTTLIIANVTFDQNKTEMQILVDTYPLPTNKQRYWKKAFQNERKKLHNCTYATSQIDFSGISSTSRTSSTFHTTATPETTSSWKSVNISEESKDNHKVGNEGLKISIAVPIGLVVVVMFIYIGIYMYKHRAGRPEEGGEEAAAESIPLQTIECPQQMYMVSYYPENEDYVNTVASIVNWFREEAGLDMIMDKMATPDVSSKGPERWAEYQVHTADKILVFLSPGYNNVISAHKENLLEVFSDIEKRLWYEIQLLKSIYCSTRSAAKIVSVVVNFDRNMNVKDLPPWVGMIYCWPNDKEKILKRLTDTAEIAPSEVAVTVVNKEDCSL